MKHIVCSVCGFVFLEEIDKCPICCPICFRDAFVEEENAYKTPDFKSESGESEKKHIPQISIIKDCELISNSIGIRLRVGEIIHPMLNEHHIVNAVFYLDNKYIAAVNFTPADLPGAIIFLNNQTKGKIQVIQLCNLHGKWYNEAEIQ
jgi:superoxide reductase